MHFSVSLADQHTRCEAWLQIKTLHLNMMPKICRFEKELQEK